MKTLNIATACFVNENRELLVVRKQGTVTWILPGGKLDGQETPANEANTSVHVSAFIALMPSNQQPVISAEIAQIHWLPLHEPLPEAAASLLRHCVVPALSSL
ncbi:MAG TPA: hypothetical protein DEB15_07565 [Pusillimonas sp.]|jgi:8-oxo-dGTP pyrophosphatase MutT (NUDIX family)|nr:hypothetical protein [Pusillimonas sp.]|tara:strand:+ start:29502 stop:29810 length:309 start_codon:yes stop_codon:yes gene_type:complete